MGSKEFEELRNNVFSILFNARIFYISHLNGKIFYRKAAAKSINKKIETLNEKNKKEVDKYFSLFKIQEEAWYCLRFSESPYNHICTICENFIKFQVTSNGYGKTCTKKECAQKLIHTKDAKEKSKETCIKKYGVENPFSNKEIKEKIKKTNLKKYGFPYVMQNKSIKEKSLNISRKRKRE